MRLNIYYYYSSHERCKRRLADEMCFLFWSARCLKFDITITTCKEQS